MAGKGRIWCAAMNGDKVSRVFGPNLPVDSKKWVVASLFVSEPSCNESMVVLIWSLERVEEDGLGQMLILFQLVS